MNKRVKISNFVLVMCFGIVLSLGINISNTSAQDAGGVASTTGTSTAIVVEKTEILSATTTQMLQTEKQNLINKIFRKSSESVGYQTTKSVEKSISQLLEEEKLKPKTTTLEAVNPDIPSERDKRDCLKSAQDDTSKSACEKTARTKLDDMKRGNGNGDSKGEKKLGFKFKDKNLDPKKKGELETKFENFKKKDISITLKNDLNTLKNNKKNRKQNDKQDFTSLKKLNDNLKKEFDTNFKNTFTKDEQDAVDPGEAPIYFESDDVYIPNDTEYIKEWDMQAIISEYPSIFSTPAVLGRPVVVAVIDSGVDYNNPELKQNMWSSQSCVDENNSLIVGGCANGYDFVSNDNDPAPTDGLDHGTGVAGLIAGSTDNGIGIMSLSQNRAKIMSLRVADAGYIDSNNLVRAVNFAINNNADIINMSLSGPTYSQALYDALNNARLKGIKVVVSSGNQGANIDATPVYPASFTLDNIYAVGSIDQSGAISSFSNYGQTVDVVAPGGAVWTLGLNNTYVSKTGTSFSAPIFSGLVARWISENKDVATEISKLSANSNYLQKVKNGRTLALSFSNIVNLPTYIPDRFTSVGGGMYMDNFAKGGNLVNSSQLNQLAVLTPDPTLGYPSLVFPGSLDSGYNSIVNGTSVTFQWNKVANAKTYGVYLTDTTGGGAIAILLAQADNIGDVSTYSFSGLVPGHTYRWNVSARKNPNSTVYYNISPTWYFKVPGGGSAPTFVSNLSPSNSTGPGYLTTSNSISLSWTAPTGATSYNLAVRDINTNSMIQDGTAVSGTSYTVGNLVNGHQYRWNVQACNNVGCSGYSSNYVSYFYYQAPVVNRAPNPPTVSGNTFGNTGVSYNFSVSATDPDGNNVKYFIDWGDGQTTNTGTYYASGATQTFSHVFSTAGTYCVRAYASDSQPASSGYSGCNYVVVSIPAGAKPNIQVATLDFANQAYTAGGTVTVNVTVTNSGQLTSGPFKTRIYLYNQNNTYTLGDITSTGLGAGASELKSITATLPASTNQIYYSSGNYLITATTDIDNQIIESSEVDNNFGRNISVNLNTGINVGNIANQTINTLFPISLSGITQPVGTIVNIVTQTGDIPSLSFVRITGTTQNISLSLPNIASEQKFILTVNGQVVGQSNVFSVSTPTTQNNQTITNAYNSITYALRDQNNLKVIGVKVLVCPIDISKAIAGGPTDSTACSISGFYKISDQSGIITLSGAEVGNLSTQGAHLRFETSQYGNNTNVWYVPQRSGSAVVETKKLNLTLDTTHLNPIILVPGIMGSTVKNDKHLIPYLDNSVNSSNPDANNLQIADPMILKSTAIGTQGVSSLGWEENRKAFRALGYVDNQTLIDCPYDWSHSVENSAVVYFSKCVDKAINEQVKLGRASSTVRVDVIAHSMGGLVTRAYIQRDVNNAKKVRQILFVGTPNQGATDAYYPWEGGNPKDWTREGVLERTYKAFANDPNGITGITATQYGNLALFNGTIGGVNISNRKFFDLDYIDPPIEESIKIKNFLENYKIYGVKQLLPTYKFIDSNPNNGTTSDVIKIENTSNQNGFLLALNGEQCVGVSCNEGAVNGTYNFMSLRDAKVNGGISKIGILYGGTKADNTRLFVNADNTQTPVYYKPSRKLYEDGVPLNYGFTEVSAVRGYGDKTVPVGGTQGFAQLTNQNAGMNVYDVIASEDPATQSDIEHGSMMKTLVNSIVAFETGQPVPNLSSLQAVNYTARMNISTNGIAGVKVVEPGTVGVVGVDEVSGGSVQTATNVENVNIGANSANISLTDPTNGVYTLYIHGQTEGDVSVYIDYGNTTTGKQTYTEFLVHHYPGVQTLTFTLNNAAVDSTSMLGLDGKYLQEVQNVKVQNNIGKTKITFTPATGTVLPIKYKVFGKLVPESNFTLLGTVDSGSNMSFVTLDDFAGTDDTKTRQYKIVGVYQDGSETIMSKTYYNNDTDWDGIIDADESKYGTSITNPDTDGDGLTDGLEVFLTQTDPTKVDSDNNGVDDYNQNKAKYGFKDKATVTTTVTTTTSVKAGLINKGGTSAFCLREGHDLAGAQPAGNGSWRHTGVLFATREHTTATFWPTLNVTYNTGGADIITSFSSLANDVSMNGSSNNNQEWMSQRSNTTGTFVNQPVGSNKMGAYQGINSSVTSNINRAFFSFNTASIPTTATVKSASIDLTPTQIENDYNDGYNFISLFRSRQADPNNITGNDWQACGEALNAPTDALDSYSVNNFVVNAKKTFNFPTDVVTSTTTSGVVNNIPSITLPGAASSSIVAGNAWTDPGATASDVEDGDITSKIIKSGSVNINQLGTHIILYSVTDSGGLSTSTQRIINVLAPVATTSSSGTISTIVTTVKSGLINQGGFSAFCAREGHDLENTGFPNGSSWMHTGILFASSENTTQTMKPALNITYNTGGSDITTKIYGNVNDVGMNSTGYGSQSWTDQRANTNGQFTNNPQGGTKFGAYQGILGVTFSHVNRAFFMFDTTSIPPGSTIKSASIELTPTDILNDFPDGKNYISFFKSNQVNPQTVVAADWQSCGEKLNNPTDALYTKNVPDFVANTKVTFNLPTIQTVVITNVTPTDYLKMNGSMGSIEKKKNEISNSEAVSIENAILAAGRDGISGNAYGVDSSYNHYLETAVSKTPGTQNISYSFWYKSNVNNWNGNTLMSAISSDATRNFLYVQMNGDSLRVYGAWGGNELVTPFVATGITNNKWHKIDVILENVGGASVKLYVDGLLVSSGTNSLPMNFTNMSNRVVFGAMQNYSSKAFFSYSTFTVDDFKVYGRALTAAEVSGIYASENMTTAILSGFSLNSVDEIINIPEVMNQIIESTTIATSTVESAVNTVLEAATSTVQEIIQTLEQVVQ